MRFLILKAPLSGPVWDNACHFTVRRNLKTTLFISVIDALFALSRSVPQLELRQSMEKEKHTYTTSIFFRNFSYLRLLHTISQLSSGNYRILMSSGWTFKWLRKQVLFQSQCLLIRSNIHRPIGITLLFIDAEAYQTQLAKWLLSPKTFVQKSLEKLPRRAEPAISFRAMRRRPYRETLIDILCLREGNLNPSKQRGDIIFNSPLSSRFIRSALRVEAGN